MRIYVDGDACPVKSEVLKVAERYQVPVTIVSNGGLRPSRDPMIQHVIVPHGADAADDWIAEHISAGELVITADIPLASRCLEKDAQALGPTGRFFDAHNIGMALSMRELNQHLRETGESKGYNRPFEPKDRSNFLQALDKVLAKAG